MDRITAFEFVVIFKNEDGYDFIFNRPKGLSLLKQITNDIGRKIHLSNIGLRFYIPPQKYTYDLSQNKLKVILDYDTAKQSNLFDDDEVIYVDIDNDYLNKFVSCKSSDTAATYRNAGEDYVGHSISYITTFGVGELIESWKNSGFPLKLTSSPE